MISAQDRLSRDIDRVPLMSAETERTELAAYAAGDVEAGRRVVAANMRFVLRVARGYAPSNQEEAIGAGMLGLANALRTFDPSFGVRFITHAGYHVRVRIQRHIQENARMVQLPTHHHARKALRVILSRGTWMQPTSRRRPR